MKGIILYFRWVRHIRRHMRNFLRFSLVAFLSCSLIMMGSLFWIDNSWALIFDDDPQTMVDIVDYLDGDLDDDSGLQDDDDGIVPITGGTLIRGNGDQDDNKEETFQLCRQVGRLIDYKTHSAMNGFEERYTTRSYKDFGHLKVMPVGDNIADIISTSLLTRGKASPLLRAAFFI